MKSKGFFWHVHHDILLEYCYDYEERVKFIKEYKPPDEIEARLALFKPVKGKLPDEVREAWKAYEKAREAYDKAWKACNKAEEACDEAWQAYKKARKAYDKAEKAYEKAREAYDKAWKAYLKVLAKHSKEINALHKRECPNCIWNGKVLGFSKWKK